jgi:hypothetical protein
MLAACACALLQPAVAWSEGARGVRQLRSTLPGELSARHLTVLGLRVGNDRLGALPANLGRPATFSPESAPQLLTTCFVDADDRSLAVTFQAQRYDPAQRVTVAHIGSAAALDAGGRRCRSTPGLADAAATASGIYLGMTRDAFAAQFPHLPSESSDRLLGYYFYQRAAGDCQLLSGVRAQFDRGELAAVTVYRLYRGRQC